MSITIVIGILFAASRIWLGLAIEPEPFSWFSAYKDAAHLFMGGLAVAWWFQRHAWQWQLFWSLNVVEVAMAVSSRM